MRPGSITYYPVPLLPFRAGPSKPAAPHPGTRMPWGYLSCSRLTGTDFVNRLGPGCVIMEVPSDSLNLDGAMPDGKPRARKTSFVPLKVGCSASLLLGQRVPGDCGAGHGAVFYRLWNAAKRRPRRAMFVAGSALMAGTWAHMLLSWVTLVNQVERDASLPQRNLQPP